VTGEGWTPLRANDLSRTARVSPQLALTALLVLALAPLLGHHLVPPPSAVQHGHLVNLCLVALHGLLSPVHGVFHLLFFSGLAYAVWDRARAWLAARRTLNAISWSKPERGQNWWRAADAAGIDPSALRVVSATPAVAFTVGWWRPVIYVGADAAKFLTPEQLAAVLEHEAAHVTRRDPLRLSLVRFLACTLYWLPVARRLTADIADDVEMMADDAVSDPLVLASAILASARPRTYAPVIGWAWFHGTDLIHRRVRRLVGEPLPPRRATPMAVGGALTVLVLLAGSGIVAAHPAPGDAPPHAEHCADHDSVWQHLFCRFDRTHRSSEDCPHVVPIHESHR